MMYTVQGAPLYAYTGGKAFDAHRSPPMVFIHGVLNDHSVWILQSRYFANHGWNVLAIDLPGHGKSGGKAPATVQSAAESIVALLDARRRLQSRLDGPQFWLAHCAARSPPKILRASPSWPWWGRPTPCAFLLRC
jgi:pimeloyl-ACP methyl ester carboxylesterase